MYDIHIYYNLENHIIYYFKATKANLLYSYKSGLHFTTGIMINIVGNIDLNN